MDEMHAAGINDLLPPEILYDVFLFVGHGHAPCVPRMVCRWWRDVVASGAHGDNRNDARLLRARQVLDLLPRDCAPETLIARAAWTITLVAPPDGDCGIVFQHLCAVLGGAGRWQQVLILVGLTPRALDTGAFASVASGAAACIRSDDVLGCTSAANARRRWLCAGLCAALKAGNAITTAVLCTHLGACVDAPSDDDCIQCVDAATTTAAQRAHVDAVLAQQFCPGANVALLWDSVVRSRNVLGFAKLVETVRAAGPDAMASARRASWTSDRSRSVADANLRSLALGWYGGGWTRPAATAGWSLPFDLATDETDDMALGRHHPYRASTSCLWADAAVIAAQCGHDRLAARLTAAAARSL
ncbi:hypothetical protein psal_cds_921 [Pandoravirus salinus]|uniref:Uncharacterized protein n=1 Tax=Pandoravirus salinus TaxID=1349410 RepID=S4W384_9VIRU|nr:hypothetical protein psal_cds_921 [Pandoravirus salinus]AGO85047.1 hypothetical protein psal_cds_921 [Pandoravirus salinus]